MDFRDDKYELIEPLREGGMGAIYKVRHRLLDEVRVVKVMRPHASQDPELRRRFLQEAKLAIRVRHPNIAQLHDFSMDEAGTATMIMEFIDGVTLQDVLKSGPPPGLPLVVEIGAQTLQALACLHFNGIVHRDVASDNVMLTRGFDGRPIVKLIDLGIARDPQGEATTTGMFIGKARYASPEQFRAKGNERPTPASDMYSFGVLFYELLTGRHPFEGSGFVELATAHLFNPPASFDVSDPQGLVPPPLRALVLDALEKDPARRIQSAEEFTARLRSAVTAEPIDGPELERLLQRARVAAPRARRPTPTPPAPQRPAPSDHRGGIARDRGRRLSQVDTVIDAVVSPVTEVTLDVLEVVNRFRSERRFPPRKAGAGAGAAARPRPAMFESEERSPEEQDGPGETEGSTYALHPVRRPSPAVRRSAEAPRRARWPLIAAGSASLVGFAAMAIVVMRMFPAPDPLAGQIENALRQSEDSEQAVTDKLERIAALIALLPPGDDRRNDLAVRKERLVNLRELDTVADRLTILLRQTTNIRGDSDALASAALDGENLWVLFRASRSQLPVNDRAADEVVRRARVTLRDLAESTGSTRLGELAKGH
jgi:serine/threonine-protein kinase